MKGTILILPMRREGLIDLNEAVQHPGTKLRFEISTELPNEEDLDLVAPVSGVLEVQSTGNILLLDGKFETKCVVECARCSHPLEKSISFEMADEFQVSGVPSGYGTGDFAKVDAEEDFPLFNENSLMRDDYLRQGLLLNIPVQSLCEHGWDGTCPFNKGDHLKKFEGGHPSMQKLQDLLDPGEEGGK